jgi:hypothetical protein
MLTTDQVANTLMMVIEAESREALGRLQDNFYADAEGHAAVQDTAGASSPTAGWTTTTYFDI